MLQNAWKYSLHGGWHFVLIWTLMYLWFKSYFSSKLVTDNFFVF